MYKKCEEILNKLESEGKIKISDYQFPQPQELKLRLKDILEQEVDEKYYLKDYQIENIKKSSYIQKQKIIQEKDWCDTLCARDWKDHKCVEVLEPQIIKYDAKVKVKVRKYPVDTEKLKLVLRDAKLEKDVTNEWIAHILDVPETTVEHWFRKDNAFSIPTPNIWLKLKEYLEIKTDEFDESITTFEEKDNVYEKNGRIYDTNGIAPTLTLSEEKIVDPKIEVVGNYMPSGHDASRIVDSNGIAPTVKENHETVTATIENYRIRKLTPKEVWRLMGFDDEDFEKAAKVNSNTQLYKQARKLNLRTSTRKDIYKLIERGLNV